VTDYSSLNWVRSSLCETGPCAEVAALPGGGVAIRNSRDPGTVQEYTRDEWAAFTGGARLGEFDDFGQPAGDASGGRTHEQEFGEPVPAGRARDDGPNFTQAVV
jgi:hypothetical protein